MSALKQGRVALAFVCVVLGIMLAVQFRTTQDIRSTIPFQRAEDLSLRLRQAERERDNALRQLQELQNSTISESVAKEAEQNGAAFAAVGDADPAEVATARRHVECLVFAPAGGESGARLGNGPSPVVQA